MTINYHIPHFPLRKFVKSIFCYEGYTGTSKYEIIVPDGSPQLLIELDGNSRFVSTNIESRSSYSAMKKSWIRGLFSQPVIYQSEQNASTLCVQFELHGLRSLLGVSAEELTNAIFDTTLLLGNEIIELRERMIETQRFEDRIKMMESYLWQKLSDAPKKYTGIEQLVSLANFSDYTLDEIGNELGYSKKHTIAMFREAIGLTPHKLQLLLNVNKSIQLFTGRHSLSMAQTSIECNHFDQSHFIKNFKLFTSMTPQQYLNQPKLFPHVIAMD